MSPVWLYKNWDAEKRFPSEKGFSIFWRDRTKLNVAAFFEDSDVFSEASPRNDKTWEKGDVFEFFFQLANQKSYYELHVAPNLATLELSIPDREKLLNNEYPFESLFYESGMDVKAGMINNKKMRGWWANMKIPLDKIGISSVGGTVGRFSVCRYNYNRNWGKTPECSSSSPLTILSFHRPHEWQEMIFD